MILTPMATTVSNNCISIALNKLCLPIVASVLFSAVVIALMQFRKMRKRKVAMEAIKIILAPMTLAMPGRNRAPPS